MQTSENDEKKFLFNESLSTHQKLIDVLCAMGAEEENGCAVSQTELAGLVGRSQGWIGQAFKRINTEDVCVLAIKAGRYKVMYRDLSTQGVFYKILCMMKAFYQNPGVFALRDKAMAEAFECRERTVQMFKSYIRTDPELHGMLERVPPTTIELLIMRISYEYVKAVYGDKIFDIELPEDKEAAHVLLSQMHSAENESEARIALDNSYRILSENKMLYDSNRQSELAIVSLVKFRKALRHKDVTEINNELLAFIIPMAHMYFYITFLGQQENDEQNR